AFHAIKAGEGDTYIAAGVEAVSRATQGGDFEFHKKLDGSEGSLYNVYIPMGLTAENVAEEKNVSRQAQDEWAAISQQRAVASQESGHFDSEIVPVTAPAHTVKDKEGNEVEVPETVVSKDDGPRAGTTLEKLSQLPPAFKPDGTVTAGNACPLNDGAAALLVMSQERAAELGLTPKVRILASTVTAIRPEVMGLGPIPAIQQLLKNTGMSMSDIDVVEINEAFAAQIVPCMQELGISEDKLNPFGGAIALGHPFGMTGARIMTTLINDLQTLDGTYGIESMCVAGGMGMAMLVERLS
ncbi:MAG: acetyl-CoA C-acyltransferase, partial [Solirubrobacteraceae bacterium]